MRKINKFILMFCLILTCICTLDNSTSYAASDFQIKNGVHTFFAEVSRTILYSYRKIIYGLHSIFHMPDRWRFAPWCKTFY